MLFYVYAVIYSFLASVAFVAGLGFVQGRREQAEQAEEKLD